MCSHAGVGAPVLPDSHSTHWRTEGKPQMSLAFALQNRSENDVPSSSSTWVILHAITNRFMCVMHTDSNIFPGIFDRNHELSKLSFKPSCLCRPRSENEAGATSPYHTRNRIHTRVQYLRLEARFTRVDRVFTCVYSTSEQKMQPRFQCP